MKRIAVLGATGSVGRSAFEVLGELRATHRVVCLAARADVEGVVSLVREHAPEVVALADPEAADRVRRLLSDSDVSVLGGEEAAVEALQRSRPDRVVAAISGAAGLAPAIWTLKLGADLLLANKEALVVAGHLVTRLARDARRPILPVDSEHSAIHQVLRGEDPKRVRRLYLTASGGPFWDLPRERFAAVTPQAALDHPTWNMGPKISVDSATMMNKALEIVEARWLFGVPASRIRVLVHRQSVVHSMVEFVDGSILAQLGSPSMTVPLRYALAYPDRAPTCSSYFDLETFSRLTFESPDLERFPALALGRRVADAGGTAGAVLNAANEVAVAAFLAGRLPFDRIVPVVERVLDRADPRADPDLEEILQADAWAREETERWIRTK